MRKLIFTIVISGMIFLMNSVPGVFANCPTDPYEPNNNPAQAFMLSYSDTVTNAWICPIEDYDYFKFQVTEGDYVRVFEIFPTVLRPTIYIFDENQIPIFNNLYINDLKFFAPYTGTVYIAVTKRYWNNEPFEYSFGLQKIDVAPDVISVTDVPNDQGLQVKVTWKPSYFDPQNGINQTDSYALWREVDFFTDAENLTGKFDSFENINYSGIVPGDGNIYEIDGTDWTFLAQIPAVSNRPFTNYSYIAPTLQDNVPANFIVSAIPLQGYSLPYLWGEPGAGTSVDNLLPVFTGYSIQPHSSAIQLSWHVDLQIHYDLAGFRVYRHTSQGFTPDDQTKIADLNKNSQGYMDENVSAGTGYFYIVESFDNSSNSVFTPELSVTITNITSEPGNIPNEFKLSQNYPNPFNPVTQIRFDIAVQSFVEMNIYNGAGQLVKVLVNEIKTPGNYNITFDASGLPSGVYFYSLRAGDFRDSKRFILLK